MIRQALATDAPALSKLIMLAMDELALKFVNGKDANEASKLFERFAGQPGNQYSFENALVFEDETGICGAIIGYDGGQLEKLRAPFLQYIKTSYGFCQPVENETQPGEYYIDCLGVFAGHQGKGIGKKLIMAFTRHAAGKGHFTTGLLVNKSNAKAKAMYTGLGFKVVNERHFVGDGYLHMQYQAV